MRHMIAWTTQTSHDMKPEMLEECSGELQQYLELAMQGFKEETVGTTAP